MKKIISFWKRNSEKIDKISTWVAFSIIFIYFFLKIIGVLHSPLSADVIALASTAFIVGKYAKKFESGLEDTKELKKDFKKYEKDILELKHDVFGLKTDATGIRADIKEIRNQDIKEFKDVAKRLDRRCPLFNDSINRC